MTRDDIIRMAREAGALFPDDGSYHIFEMEGSLERFADLVAAAERETVLDLVDAYAKNNTDLAVAIRARGETE